jgi:hypothetical protein
MNQTFADFCFALRSFRRTPLITAVALLSMALGIGANTAIFSVLDQILLRLMPVKNPQELVIFQSIGPNSGRLWDDGTHTTFSYPMYRDMASQNQVFTGVLARFRNPASLAYKGATERAFAELVSGNYFEVLGVGSTIGRTLTPDDDRVPGGHPLAVLSYECWRSRFGGDPSILNKTVLVNGQPMTVVGVAQAGFRGFDAGATADLFVPMAMKKQMTPGWDDLNNRRSFWLQMVARRKPGMTVEQAQASINALYQPILQEELKQLPAKSQYFRERFLKKTVTLLAPVGTRRFETSFRRR